MHHLFKRSLISRLIAVFSALTLFLGLCSTNVSAEPLKIEPFQAAEDFSVDTVPVNVSARKYLAITLKNYADWKGPKALAIAVDGSWFQVERKQESSRVTSEQLMQFALEKCEWWSRAPCALYALGDKVALGMEKTPLRAHTSVLQMVGSFDSSRLPFASQATASVGKMYQDKDIGTSGHKVLALSPLSGRGTGGWGSDSIESFKKGALNGCVKDAKDDFCVIYAVDGEVVVGKSNGAATAIWPPAAPQKLQLLYIGAPGSPPHLKWESNQGLLQSLKGKPWFPLIELTSALTSGPEVTATDDFLPEQFKWVSSKIRPSSFGLARLIFIVDGTPMFDLSDIGRAWNYLSLMESLAKRKQ